MVFQFLVMTILCRGILNRLLWIYAIILLYGLPHSYALSQAEQIIIIVNANGPLVHISASDIRDIYMGEIKFVQGIRILPIHYPEGHVKDIFLSQVLGQSSKAYRLHWTKKVFQEGLTLPAIKSNPREIVELVETQPGAIGYVPRQWVNGHKGLRIVSSFEIIKP